MSYALRTVPGWTVSSDSAANAAQTLTRVGEQNSRQYVNSFEVVIIGAPASADITVQLKEGSVVRWKTAIGSGAPRGDRTGMSFSNPIRFGVNTDVTLVVDAGGAGVVTSANIEGFTL